MKMYVCSICIISVIFMLMAFTRFPYKLSRDIMEKLSVMGTPSLQPFLKSYCSRQSNWLANCRKACKYDELERQYKCGTRNVRIFYVRIFSFKTDSCKMMSYCRICGGLIENPPDIHDHCIACLGLAHAEAALEESDCAQCADLPLHVLRTRRNVARGLFRVRPTAANVPLVGPPSPLEGGDDNLARSHRSQRSL